MNKDNLLPFSLPAICRKKVSVAFDGGMLSSDAGVLLLRGVERHLGVAARLATCLKDRRDSDRIDHTVEEMLRLRMFAIAAGYEDANDCNKLRDDPVFKMAVGRAPGSGEALCSQPTMSRLENAPSRIEIARLMLALVDQFCASYARAPASIILDIDDTFDAVHGRQQLSLFNAHYDERCFLPIHIYEGTSGKPVAVILRSGKTPGGIEVRTILKHVIARIRRHWPKVNILVRGDSHYGGVQGDGLVRSQWDWLHLRLRRQPGARRHDPVGCRRGVRRARGDRNREAAPLEARCVTAPRVGKDSAVSSPGSRRRSSASMSVTSSPRSRAAPSISMRQSTVAAAKRRTSSSYTRPSSPRIVRRAVTRGPIRCASSCTRRLIGCFSLCALPRPSVPLGERPSSRRCDCG